jgi:hypothetical protein
MIRGTLPALVLLGCIRPSTNACERELFCPEHTTCGGSGVCLVADGECARFADRTPCERDTGRGHCRAGSCEEGVELVGASAAFPFSTFLVGVTAALLDHPDVLPDETNLNGFFNIRGTPRDTDVVVELSYPDALTVVTRSIAIGQSDVQADASYGAIPIVFDEVVAQIADTIGVPFDPALGIVVGSTFDRETDAPVADVVTNIPAADCAGPYYFDATGPDPSATATLAATGVFVFANCSVGRHELIAMQADTRCRAFDAVADGPTQLEIVPGKMLFVGRLVCP